MIPLNINSECTMKNLVTACLLTVLYGCSSHSSHLNYSNLNNYNPTYNIKSDLNSNEIRTVSVGEYMLSQSHSKEYLYDAIKPLSGAKISDLDFDKLSDKSGFLKKGEDSENEYYGGVPYDNYKSTSFYIQLSKIGEPACILNYYSNGVVSLPFCNSRTNDSFKFVKFKKEVTREEKNSLQQTLIYNGKSGNTISLGYREFKDDLARSAFSNDVNYDLKDSKTIAYKGSIIEVIKADNQSITYKVIKNFN